MAETIRPRVQNDKCQGGPGSGLPTIFSDGWINALEVAQGETNFVQTVVQSVRRINRKHGSLPAVGISEPGRKDDTGVDFFRS